MSDIRESFNPLVPLALKGFRAMAGADGVFCHAARRGAGGGLKTAGRSYRYTAMSVVGLAMQERLGNTAGLPLDRCCDALVSWIEGGAPLGDAGLALWALSARRDGRAEQVARRLGEPALAGQVGAADSMALGWLLAGLGAAGEEDSGGAALRSLAGAACEELFARQAGSGLFRLGSARFRKNVFAWRSAARLASFASTVYPTIGLAYYARAAGSAPALEAARRAADALCRLQGPQGQWWWICDAATGAPVVRYPVYSVHQDGMGPMALLAVCLAGGPKDEYLRAAARSVAWLESRPELPGEPLIEPDRGAVWRAIQRDRPDRTGGFGLGRRERFRMNLAAWTGLPDTRPWSTGYVCEECRPYHLGWILTADAMAAGIRETFH